MAKVLVLYYSRSGNTEAMAGSVSEGAKEAGAEVDLRKVEGMEVDSLLDYDAIIIGSPTYYGGPAAEVKKLLDDSVKFHGKLAGKVGGAFSSSGGPAGGNETTILAILQAMLVHGMVVEGSSKDDHYGPVSVGAPDEEAKKRCIELGRRVAALASRLA